MATTLMMLGVICLLATVLMFDFVVVIPKFGSKYFGAPDDIKEMASKMPDQPAWVNALGVLILVVGFAGVAAVLVWAVRDTLETKMSFWETFLRFLILFEGYKLFDVVCFDYLMLTKLKLPVRIYPETAGFKGYDSFGFNAKSQIGKAVAFAVISLLMACILTMGVR